jgi:nucleotide-binding universal stress UspA family protein
MYTRIFVAYDASSCAIKALDEAIHLARSQAATLCIAHVDDAAVATTADSTSTAMWRVLTR